MMIWLYLSFDKPHVYVNRIKKTPVAGSAVVGFPEQYGTKC